jgi:hypothetical protein
MIFNIFKKKPADTHITKPSIPMPLAGRDGHVGGIESLVLDGVTYYFGFDFGSDLVVSPLIDDIDLMARFASQHMQQRDGSHDEAYWRELAGEDSELSADAQSRIFTSQELVKAMAELRLVSLNNVAAPNFNLEYHLRYLLASAGEWAAGGDEFEAAGDYISMIRGDMPLPDDTRFSDAAQHLQKHITALISAAPGNWSGLFSMLKS